MFVILTVVGVPCMFALADCIFGPLDCIFYQDSTSLQATIRDIRSGSVTKAQILVEPQNVAYRTINQSRQKLRRSATERFSVRLSEERRARIVELLNGFVGCAYPRQAEWEFVEWGILLQDEAGRELHAIFGPWPSGCWDVGFIDQEAVVLKSGIQRLVDELRKHVEEKRSD